MSSLVFYTSGSGERSNGKYSPLPLYSKYQCLTLTYNPGCALKFISNTSSEDIASDISKVYDPGEKCATGHSGCWPPLSKACFGKRVKGRADRQM